MAENESGSLFKVPYTTILDVQPHSNADRLEVCTVYGFQVIASKGKYKIGNKVIYIPIDSILPSKLEAKLFPEDSKIKLTKSRVRQIRIRKLASQGMLIDPSEVSDIVNTSYIKDEQDLKDVLGVTKYEPPQAGPTYTAPSLKSRKILKHPDFHEYNSLNNIKWFPDKFKDGDEVIIQEKLHGTNARVAKLPFRTNTLWKKIKGLFGLNPKFENLYGSNKVDISNASTYTGWYGEDIYGKCFNKLNVFNKFHTNMTLFGEIVGPGIQSGYSYGLKEHKFVLFDIKVLCANGKQIWYNPEAVENYARMNGFDFVPVLYRGPYNKALASLLSSGPSEFNDKSEKVREGIVIKKRYEYDNQGNKEALKWINEDYLDNKQNTDNH